MKLQTQHTPTPWRFRFEDWHVGFVISVPKNQSDIYRSYGWDHDDGGGSGIAICSVPNGCAGEGSIAEANAAYIVRAVNAHEELLEALKFARRIVAAEIENDEAVQKIDEAIAKAEGK